MYSVAEYRLSIDNPDSVYLQYAKNKVRSLRAESSPKTNDEAVQLIAQIKTTEVPANKSTTSPSVWAYVLLAFLCILMAVLGGRIPSGRYFAALAFPVSELLVSLLFSGRVFVLGLWIAAAAVNIFIAISGGYRHARKDGGADRRYKDNPYVHTFADGSRAVAGWGLLGTAIVGIILGMATA